MKQFNSLSPQDNKEWRKDYQSPFCKVNVFVDCDIITTSRSEETPIEWNGNWNGFLTGTYEK